jgi:hypothetical protein
MASLRVVNLRHLRRCKLIHNSSLFGTGDGGPFASASAASASASADDGYNSTAFYGVFWPDKVLSFLLEPIAPSISGGHDPG